MPPGPCPLPDARAVAWIEDLTGRGCVVVAADQTVIAVGARAERITGFRAGEAVGRDCHAVLRCHGCVERCGVMAKGVVRDVPLTLFRKDGSTVEVVKSGVVLRGEGGEPCGTVELVAEISAAGGGALAADVALDRILAALGRWFVAADAAGRLVRWSGRLPGLLGYDDSALAGMPIETILGEALFGADAEFRSAVLGGERREGWHAEISAADGRVIPVSLSAAPVGHCSGALPGSGCSPDSALLVMIRPDEQLRSARAGESEIPNFSGIIARSAAMHRVFRLIDQIRDTEATVLITGESGTGKELVARAIHARSSRGAGPFVALNCGALPEALLESELFGHARGAFTGAVRDKPGRFEAADGGTLFLDEVGDLPLPLQVKLLRVLQERSFERLGENRTRSVDVRVLAATHVDLAQAVADRTFREDLYYRLRVVPVHIPPLRERREDLEVLIRHFLGRIGRARGRALRLSPAAMRALLSHAWPGNVRELENAIEYATAVCEGQTIHPGDLPDSVIRARQPAPQAVPPAPVPMSPDAEHAEAERILSALRQAGFRKGKAAEALGMSRTTFWRKLKLHRLG